MIVRYRPTGQLGEIPDDKFDPSLFERAESKSQQVTQPQLQPQLQPQQKSVGGFLGNIGRDVGENIQGLLSLPGVLGQILSGQTSLPQVGEALGKGVYEEYKGLVTKPVETAYQKPVSSIIDVLPFLKIPGLVGKVGQAGKAAKAAQVAGKTTEIESILSKAQAVGKGQKVSPLATNIYQSAFNIPRKNYAFERLTPSETASEMVRYGIKGNTDQVLQATEKVTGRNGILSNVVNNAIADVGGETNISRVHTLIRESKGGIYSALPDTKIDELSLRLRKLGQGKKIDNIETSKLLDFTRTLEKEATQHRLAATRGDTAAGELSNLKFSVADEIESLLDKAVKGKRILEAYKSPKIIEELKKVSPILAKEFQKAESIGELRALQKPFVRMNKILDLVANEPSGLSQKYLGGSILTKIPALGQTLEMGAKGVAAPISTGLASLINYPAIKAPSSLVGAIVSGGVRAGVKTAKSPLSYILGRQLVPTADEQTQYGQPQTYQEQEGQDIQRQFDQGVSPPATTIPQDVKQEQLSPQGQWRWDEEKKDWVPNTAQAGMPSREQLEQAMYQDLQTTGGKRISELKTLYDVLFPKAKIDAKAELKRTAGIDVIEQVEKTPDNIKNQTGTAEAFKTYSFLNFPLNLGRPLIRGQQMENLADLETKYFLLVQTVLTYIQGSRPSDYDVKSYQNKAGPSIQFPSKVNENRIKNLLDLLKSE